MRPGLAKLSPILAGNRLAITAGNYEGEGVTSSVGLCHEAPARAESKIEQITGSDTISARAPYGLPFDYRPLFKIWLSTNNKPEIKGAEDAIWDRLRIIPFEQRFEGKKADRKLPDRLREELPGVLAWAVRGCLEWGEHGLGTSKAVEGATQEYREEMDTFALFISDRLVVDKRAFITSKDVHHEYTTWADEMGERPLSQTKLGRELKTRGFQDGRDENATRGWFGLGLKTLDSPPPPSNVSKDENPSKTQENAQVEPPSLDTFCHVSPKNSKPSRKKPHVEKFLKTESNVSKPSRQGGSNSEEGFEGTFVTDEKAADKLAEELGI